MNVQEADEIKGEADAIEAARARAPRAAELANRLFDAVVETPVAEADRKVRLELNWLSLDRWIQGTTRDLTDEEAAAVEALLR